VISWRPDSRQQRRKEGEKEKSRKKTDQTTNLKSYNEPPLTQSWHITHARNMKLGMCKLPARWDTEQGEELTQGDRQGPWNRG